MKKKDEMKADKRLKELGVTPWIYHFVARVEPFTAVTIAENVFGWESVGSTLDDIFFQHISVCPFEKATKLIEELRKREIYGVAICDSRDKLDRQRGRTIAKGRLAK